MGNNYTKLIGVQGTDGEYQYQSAVNSLYAGDLQKIVTIAKFGDASADFNFTNPANPNPQSINLGPIMLANYVMTGLVVKCLESVVGMFSPQQSVGRVALGQEYILVNVFNNIGDTLASTTNFSLYNWTLPSNIFFTMDPQGDNWNLLTAGKWQITVNYKNFNI